jgi:hypothetical protein
MKSMKIQKNATQPSPPFMSFMPFMVEGKKKGRELKIKGNGGSANFFCKSG